MSFRCSISRNEVEVLYHKGGLETDESTEIIFVSVKVGIKPAGNKMFKVNNRNSRTRCEICSKLTIKVPERRHWRRSDIFIVNLEHISHLALLFLLLTLSR